MNKSQLERHSQEIDKFLRSKDQGCHYTQKDFDYAIKLVIEWLNLATSRGSLLISPPEATEAPAVSNKDLLHIEKRQAIESVSSLLNLLFKKYKPGEVEEKLSAIASSNGNYKVRLVNVFCIEQAGEWYSVCVPKKVFS